MVDSPPTPAGKVRPASVSGERRAAPVDHEARAIGGASRRRHPAGVGLGVGDLAVAIGVEVEAGLEGRDLRLVDDDVEEDPVGFDADARRSG